MEQSPLPQAGEGSDKPNRSEPTTHIKNIPDSNTLSRRRWRCACRRIAFRLSALRRPVL